MNLSNQLSFFIVSKATASQKLRISWLVLLLCILRTQYADWVKLSMMFGTVLIIGLYSLGILLSVTLKEKILSSYFSEQDDHNWYRQPSSYKHVQHVDNYKWCPETTCYRVCGVLHISSLKNRVTNKAQSTTLPQGGCCSAAFWTLNDGLWAS